MKLLVWIVMPYVWWWVWREERRVLSEGRKLTEEEWRYAARVGVRHPERMRVVEVGRVRVPGWGWMQRVVAQRGFSANRIEGMCLRYGIVVRNCQAGGMETFVHECVHTAQYERLGGIGSFIRRYLHQCMMHGYGASLLEREAYEKARALGVSR